MTAARPLAVAAALAASLLGGCAMPTIPTIQPWVKPYERERLGDPIMKLSRDALPDKHFEHVRDVREGARGAAPTVIGPVLQKCPYVSNGFGASHMYGPTLFLNRFAAEIDRT